jgi:hypothetical protein
MLQIAPAPQKGSYAANQLRLVLSALILVLMMLAVWDPSEYS